MTSQALPTRRGRARVVELGTTSDLSENSSTFQRRNIPISSASVASLVHTSSEPPRRTRNAAVEARRYTSIAAASQDITRTHVVAHRTSAILERKVAGGSRPDGNEYARVHLDYVPRYKVPGRRTTTCGSHLSIMELSALARLALPDVRTVKYSQSMRNNPLLELHWHSYTSYSVVPLLPCQNNLDNRPRGALVRKELGRPRLDAGL